jgi:hypothetical protein
MSSRSHPVTLPLLLGWAWSLPTTGLGVLLGVLGGARPARFTGPERAWIWHLGKGPLSALYVRWPFRISAMTVGAVVLVDPRADSERLIAHERCHVRQAFWLGPMFVPAYFAIAGVTLARGKNPYRDHPMEIAARKAERASR